MASDLLKQFTKSVIEIMSMYDIISRKNTLCKVFRLFDSECSGHVTVIGFEDLVRCLMVLKSRCLEQTNEYVHENTREIASQVVAEFPDRIQLSEFLEAAMGDPTPFEYTRHGPGLSDTLLNFFDVNNYEILDELFPFKPTYEYQNIDVFQTIPRNCESIMSVCNSTRMAKISDPMQANIKISDGSNVRVWLGRHDTSIEICDKVVENWPGLRGRNFHPPQPSELMLLNKNKPVGPHETVESMGMFHNVPHFTIQVLTHNESAEMSSNIHETAHLPDQKTTPTSAGTGGSTNGHRDRRPQHQNHHHGKHRSRHNESGHRSPNYPPSPPNPSTPHRHTHPSTASSSSSKEKTPAGIDKEKSAEESGRISDRFSVLRQEIYEESKRFSQKVAAWQDKLLVEKDTIPPKGEMYEPYRDDLKQQAKVLSDEICALEAALHSRF